MIDPSLNPFIATFSGLVVTQVVTVWLFNRNQKQKVAERDEERTEKAILACAALAAELHQAVARVDAEAGGALRIITKELTDHRIEDARLYVTPPAAPGPPRQHLRRDQHAPRRPAHLRRPEAASLGDLP